MIIINYTKNGIAVSDFDSEEVAKSLQEGTFEFSTENVILAVRALVVEGYFDMTDIKIQQDGKDCVWTSAGHITNFDGITFDDFMDRILGLK